MTMKRPGLLSALVLSLFATTATAQQVSDGRSAISVTEIRAALLSAPTGAREAMSRDQLGRFVESLLIDQRLEQAAKAEKLDQDPEIKARMDKAARDILVRAYVEGVAARIAAKLPDLEPLARERYEAEKATLMRPEGIRVAHILFRTAQDDESTIPEAKAKAERVLGQLNAGADFAELAKVHSQDGAASKGGELPGWRDKGSLVPAFEKVAYDLRPGEISGLVRSQFGYHIIKLLEHRPAAQQPFDEVKDKLVAKVKNELMGKEREQWVKDYRGTQPVVIDDATLEAARRK